MHRRTLILTLAALPALAAAPMARAQAVDATAINDYLVRLRTASGRFTQINPNGSRQTGDFFIQKPGRIRFDYDSPEGARVIADGINVGVFDPRASVNPTRYPLARTPMSILLRDGISLREPGLVLGAERAGDEVHITVTNPERPQEGRMVMVFTEDPIRLRRWVITDAQNRRTTVTLDEMETDVALAPSLFNIELAEAQLGRGGDNR